MPSSEQALGRSPRVLATEAGAEDGNVAFVGKPERANSLKSKSTHTGYDQFGERTILAPDGSTVRTSSSYDNPYGYTSRRHDEESGLMYFRARYYDVTTGEFASRDPLEYVDGMSLMRGYFGFQGFDPTGAITIRPSRPSILGRRRCGTTTEQNFSFEFDYRFNNYKQGAPCDGVVVQKVDVRCAQADCTKENKIAGVPNSPDDPTTLPGESKHITY